MFQFQLPVSFFADVEQLALDARLVEISPHLLLLEHHVSDLLLKLRNHCILALENHIQGLFPQLVHELQFAFHCLFKLVPQVVRLCLKRRDSSLKLDDLLTEQNKVVSHLHSELRPHLFRPLAVTVEQDRLGRFFELVRSEHTDVVGTIRRRVDRNLIEHFLLQSDRPLRRPFLARRTGRHYR